NNPPPSDPEGAATTPSGVGETRLREHWKLSPVDWSRAKAAHGADAVFAAAPLPHPKRVRTSLAAGFWFNVADNIAQKREEDSIGRAASNLRVLQRMPRGEVLGRAERHRREWCGQPLHLVPAAAAFVMLAALAKDLARDPSREGQAAQLWETLYSA